MTDFLHTDAARIIMMIFMAYCAVIIIFNMVTVIRSMKKYHFLVKKESERILTTLSLLYGLGVSAKFAVIGPRWLRWYVADIGFPVMLLLVMTAFVNWKMQPSYHLAKTETETWQLKLKLTTTRFKLLAAALTISVSYELFAGLLASSSKGRGIGDVIIGEFDWVDILCYVTGSAIAAAILLHQQRIDRILVKDCQDVDDARAEEAQRLAVVQRHNTQDSRKASTNKRRGRK